MEKECVVLTRDQELRDRLAQFFEQTLHCKTLPLDDGEATFKQISGQSAPPVVLDVRPESSVLDLRWFLDEILGGRLPALDVIAIHDQQLPVPLAAHVDLLSQACLSP